MRPLSLWGNKSSLRTAFTTIAAGAALMGITLTAAAADQTDTSIILKNPGSLKWEKTIPELGDRSPEYAILHSDPNTKLTTLMFRTPIPVHIPAHTHDLAETHVILVGGTHTFDSKGVRYNIENGGFFRAPGGVVHEAWPPAGSQTLNILESGWAVNWLREGPTVADADKYPPKEPQGN
ncbi:hypothetical protein [Rhizobium sp. RM]|uniref:hypothetical protein n=1 Tax=Rhizobium sp. RM TaxID=2748079 RepID=UPI00110DE074|nr:hypothetical protein [Rhizobium sp. RM]NWJ27645.1 hypothetical protein [Rhizobium sp. RM]TMV18915.1 hypothetical protein BJG94_14940 [Rhizobium sp. Td3]